MVNVDADRILSSIQFWIAMTVLIAMIGVSHYRIQQLEEAVDDLSVAIDVKTADRWTRAEALREWEFHRGREHSGEQGEVPHSHTENWRVSP